MLTALTALTVFSQIGLAGGPWVSPSKVWSVYGGASYETFQHYVGGEGAKESKLNAPVSAMSMELCPSFGVGGGFGVDVDVPIRVVSAQGQESTAGLGTVTVLPKYVVITENEGSPVTVSVHAGLRTGAAHRSTRDRLTNIGDGSTDLGGGLSMGRYSFWSKGPWWVSASVNYWWRIPSQTIAGEKIPSDDISYSGELVMSVHERVGLGLAWGGIHRLGGLDIGANAQVGQDRWAALAASNLGVGAKAFIFLPKNQTAVLGVMRTVMAKNNPTDNLTVSVGYSLYFDGRG